MISKYFPAKQNVLRNRYSNFSITIITRWQALIGCDRKTANRPTKTLIRKETSCTHLRAGVMDVEKRRVQKSLSMVSVLTYVLYKREN